MDINDWRSLTTVVTFAMFVAIVWWAFSSHTKKAYDEAARLPLDDDDQPIVAEGPSVGHPDK
jgi:cytochrome c oxidase cbb3-type subunit IV